ncbi:ribonuclease HII [Mycoplasmopsis verecunda]|uniref:Ribonuclease HII n=1 Tax=Mycoplasmopsis verecunda TaxID=171291 RepID=A0A1T4LHJ2_9BACT|nr:ribonuclease HII [Mycoplasmopsis verecunda]WPB54604.1 ribonuclease HII [Mycoplasmopsis verecunda]SJZ54269.1 RNase HII [Mycoplasmopsis verecunda]
MLDFENKYWDKYPLIAGVDEVGRGCLAGELVVACVILPKNYQNPKIKDSKKISEKNRELLYEQIIKDALYYSIEIRTLDQINNSNPKAESKLGMKLAIEKLPIKPDLVITDFEKVDTDIEQINLVKGDNISINVAAASILAKVTRDRMLIQYAKEYSQYGFEQNKGYGTKIHLEALSKYGITPIHRIKYKPVAQIINNLSTKRK